MSGIAAIYQRDGRPVYPKMLAKMVEAMAHRGPDGMTHWVDGAIGLGHCLMHTTPESLQEHQPVCDGGCWLVWDGRLDNREDLRRTCKSEGIPRGAETDPELVLGAYQLWGQRCVERLVGEFAFVVWDERTRTLFGARDRIGLKPLYYTQKGPTLLIASEAKALLRVLDRMPKPDDELVLAMLLSECREPDNHRSLFAGIHRLPPGHTMSVKEGHVQIQRYWQINPTKHTLYKRPEVYVEHFHALLEEAVKCRTRSAFPIGVFLSGGLDSSTLATLAASHGSVVEAVTAFTEDPWSDERTHARQVCEAAGIRHWELTGTSRNPLDGLDRTLWEVECPLVSTDRNGPALTELLHSRNCRIVLDGEGGDQLLDEDGYLADLFIRTNPIRFLRETQQFAQWRGDRFKYLLQDTLTEALSPRLRALGKRILRRVPPWMNQDLARTHHLAARMCTPRVPIAFPFRCQTVAYEDVLSPYFLLKLELEEREAAFGGRATWYPFLDSRLLEFILSIPWHQFCHDGQRKWLLRQAMKGTLPETIRLRQGKGDWANVMDRSLKSVCRCDPPEPLANHSGMIERYVDLWGARQVVQQYLAGRRRVRWQVWSFVALDHWLQRFWKGGHEDVADPVTRQETLQVAEVAAVR